MLMKQMMKSLALAAVLMSVQAIAAPVQSWTTAQGTRVYFIETHALPIVDVQISFLAGSAFDPPNKVGLASMTASLLDQGAGTRNEKEVAEALADIGAQMSAAAGMDSASVTLRTLSDPERRATAIAMMTDAISMPHFDDGVFKRDQARSIAGLKEALTKPQVLSQRAYMSSIYQDHPYGRLATPESVAAISRVDLEQFWRQHYSAERASIALVGDLTRAEAEALAVQLTASLPADQRDVPRTLPKPSTTSAKVVRLDHPASQAHLLVGMPSIARDDAEQIALQVGNYTLGGGGFVSLLTKAVREDRGYAYSVYSYFDPKLVEGPFTIGLETKRTQADDALKVVHSVLDDFLKRGPTPTQLKAAQDNIAGGFALRIDSNSKLAANLGVMAFYGLPTDWLEKYPDRVRALTPEAVRSAFQKHVKPEQLVTVRTAAD
ncbi:MAG: Zinc protease [Fluviibacter phosphoraccumulans EoVTN8]